jgi:1,4-dihydroxy-2-naphthoate polyprenyltransferase
MKHWVSAFRLRTLPLALSSIAMAGFLAASVRAFQWNIFLLCVSTTIFLQILSNLANDYGDSVHGADSADRKGPSRAVQSGKISAAQMKVGMSVFVVLSLVSGITLLFVSFGLDWHAILFFLVLGILCILAAIAYTVGKKPYGYAGLGDISVFIFFGLVGVMGSLYLFTHTVELQYVLPAISCGLFSVGVLNVNNIRDIESDVKAGKYSVAVRIGRDKAVLYHWFLLIGGLVSTVVFVVFNFVSGWQFLFLLSALAFLQIGLNVQRKPSHELDPYLKFMALSTLLFVVLFGVGQMVALR